MTGILKMSNFDGKRPKALFGASEEEKDLLLTPWSVVHFLSGAACKGLGWNFWSNFALHGVYEVKDHMLKDENYNSTFNSAGDQLCSMAGFVWADHDIKWLYFWLIAYGVAYGLGKNIG